MRVLITGANGQLGWELQRTAPPHHDVVALGHKELDVVVPSAVRAAVADHNPQLIINSAGYTAVDRAESEPELARRTNVDGPTHVAAAARDHGARLLHVSTDYVFDGAQGTPYRPDDSPHPLGCYGEAKRDGERRVLEAMGSQALVVRSSWIYSARGHNFVKTMLRVMDQDWQPRVIDDQVGTPTWAKDLARALWQMADLPEAQGLHHWSNAGVASWYDFAQAIADEALNLGLLAHDVTVVPIATEEYPSPARRPRYSVLDKRGTWELLGKPAPHWRRSLRAMLKELSHA